MKKFLDKSLQKLQQDQREKKKKQQFGELVEQQKEKVRIEFYATTQASGRDLTKDNQADGVKFANILNVIQNENNNKLKRKNELEEQTENLEKFEEVNSPLKSTFSEDKKKELVNWSINLSPEVFNKLTMEMAGQYNEQIHGSDPEYLKEKFEFLTDNYEGIQTQIIKEKEITDALENRIKSLQEEEAVFIKRSNEAKYVYELMQQCLTDTQKLQHTAKNKLLRTNNNLHLLKNELKGSNEEGKEYLERLNDDKHETGTSARIAEDNFSQLLVKLELAKRSKQEYEEKWMQLVANEQYTINKIKDSVTTIRYIDILDSLKKKFIFKQQNYPVEGEMLKPISLSAQERSHKRTASIEPRKKLYNHQIAAQSLDSLPNRLESPTKKPNLSLDRTSSERIPQVDSGRAYILRKIAAFCENHNLEELADRLLDAHQTMILTEATLKEAYEKGSIEKRKKEEKLKELENELWTTMKNNDTLFEYEKSLKSTGEDTKINQSSAPTTNQMDFTFKELMPLINETTVHKKMDNFLVVSYFYLIDTMIRISKIIQGISKRSYKVSYPVVYAYEDINKYLSETLKVSPERLLRSDLTLKTRKKERAHTEMVGFLGKNRPSDTKQNEDKEKEKDVVSDKAGITPEGKNPPNRISAAPSIEKNISGAEITEEVIEINEKTQVLSKAQVIECFLEVFPGATENAERWADLVRNDQVALLIVSEEIIHEFLTKLLETHGIQTGSEKAIGMIKEFKKDIRLILQERFTGMLERIEKLFVCIAENKQNLDKEPKLFLRSLQIENMFNTTFLNNENIIDANRDRILKLLKYNDFDQYEIKNMIRGLTKLEDQRRDKQRASKSLDEVRKLIHELAKDDKVRVNEHYTQLSKENKPEAPPVDLMLPEETKTLIMKRKEESLPLLRNQKRLGLARKTLFGGGRQSVIKMDNMPPDGKPFKTILKKASILKAQAFMHQAPIIPIRVTSDSFEIERDHMEKEREAIQKEELKRRMLSEGLFAPADLDTLGDEDGNNTEKDAVTTFEVLMANPVKKIYEDSRTLERLSKLERMRAQFENKPKNTQKKPTYIPSDVSKFNMSYLDINKLRKMARTSKNTNSRDKRYGFFTPIRGTNLPNMSSTLRSEATLEQENLVTEESLLPNRLSLFSKQGAVTTSRNNLFDKSEPMSTKQTESSPRVHRFSSQRARSQLSLKDHSNRSQTPGSFIKQKPSLDAGLKKRRELSNPIDRILNTNTGGSFKTEILTMSTSSTMDLPHLNLDRSKLYPGILISNIFS